jgi:hypothetical protein
MVLAYVLAFVALFAGASVASLVTIVLVPLVKLLKEALNPTSIDSMLAEHDDPKFQPLDFSFGVLCTIITRSAGFVAAAYIFHRYEVRLPIPFVILGAVFFGVNDITRVGRFLGHVGFSTELGYLVGGIAGACLGWSISVSLFPVAQMA